MKKKTTQAPRATEITQVGAFEVPPIHDTPIVSDASQDFVDTLLLGTLNIPSEWTMNDEQRRAFAAMIREGLSMCEAYVRARDIR